MLIGLAVVVTVIALPYATAMAAADPDWQLNFAVSINGSAYLNSSFGTKIGAIDGVGPEDCPPLDGIAIPVDDYTPNAFAYTIVRGRVLTYDFRAPVTDQAKTWNIWLTATEPGTISLGTKSLVLNPCYNGEMPLTEEPGQPIFVGGYDGGLASLALWHGSDLLWNWQPGQTVTPMQSFAYNGSAIALQLVATPMSAPEPGSIVALLTGLCGLLGLARRRNIQR